MKFQTHCFRVCLIFYTYDSANFSIGNNTMKKNATRYCAGPAYYRMLNRRLLFNKPAAVAPKEPSPIISSFLELGRRKLSMQPKFVARRKCC